jgi:hypothetical protein
MLIISNNITFKYDSIGVSSIYFVDIQLLLYDIG